MLINADLSQRVVLSLASLPWVPSPLQGVERRMLERDGGEVARATSVVRYAAGSRFDAHDHALGEEFLVLDGTFVDEHGTYPAGTYVRNPPGSSHTPSSPDGCTLFVKLRQFDPADLTRVVIDTSDPSGWQPGGVPGLSILPLHRHGGEVVQLSRLEPGTMLEPHAHADGEEVLVLAGEVADEAGVYAAGTWLRNPPGSRHLPFSDNGCTLYVKRGHLGTAVRPL